MDIEALERLLNDGDFEQAKALVRAAEDYLPSDDVDWTRLHRCLQQLGMAAHDEIVTLRYLRLRPDASYPRIRLALHFMRRNRREDAQYHLMVAISKPPAASEFWKIASDIYVYLKMPLEALGAYNRALELAPNNFWLKVDYIKLLCSIDREAKPDTECRLIIDQLGGNLSKCLKTAASLDRLNLYEYSAMAFNQGLSMLISTNEREAWDKFITWMNEAPRQTRTKKLSDLEYRWRPKPVPAAELAKMRESEPYHQRGITFLNAAKNHLPDDHALLLATFEYALGQGNAEAALNFGQKILAIDPGLESLRESISELERAPKTVLLPSKIWWQNQRNANRL
jgi:tetratricopeptide (TPR) repeat protein